ncbi:hypothetical protein Zm00014a_021151 [Zea mays]|uniref:ATP-dependent DNA helicase n=1 Tax=Zea mays TaxID=4577 RepID=A0A3L6D8G9_MAIZE|nr:hypothetical protein Zm00014a_021151 [Zea mays]
MTSSYETVKHFDSLVNEKHVYKMHNVEFGINLGDRFRHISGPMELYLTRQTVVKPYTVPFQMLSFLKHIFLNLAAIAELPNRTLVNIMAIVVHLDTVQHTMWGNVRKIVVMDARWSLHTIKVWGDLLNKNALRWALANENYGIIIETMFRRFRRQEYLESSDYTAIHFNPYHHSTHHFERDQNESNSFGPMVDAKERKRKRDKERYDAMSVAQKNEKNKNRREARQRNKALSIKPNSSRVSFPDNCSTIDFTHSATNPTKNISLVGNSIKQKIQRARERRATLSVEQRNKINKKRREARQRKNGQNVQANDIVTTIDLLTPGDDDDEGIIFEEDDDENEGYLFIGQYEGTDEDINIHGTQDESTATDVPDQYDNVYNNIPEETHMLKPVPDYGYCTAKKFEYEPPGFCCRAGKVELAPLETPP